MIKLEFVGVPQDKITSALLLMTPEVDEALTASTYIKAQILPYQAAALYILAKQYDGGNLLDIGTAAGYSASIMAQAAPKACVVTLNPAKNEIPLATANLSRFHNIEIVCVASWDYLDSYNGPPLDLIFIDGDHKHVQRDVPWWAWLKKDGLMLFHDYTLKGSQPVVTTVDRMAKLLGYGPDVLLVDDRGIGMAGFYCKAG